MLAMLYPRSPIASLGDVLNDAAAMLTKAGYEGATCRTERVYCPQCPTGYYEQSVCSVPGQYGSFDANLVTQDSTYAHPGYGVDLAAEAKMYNAQAHPDDVSYFNILGSSPSTIVTATQAGPTSSALQKEPTLQQVSNQLDLAAQARANAAKAIANTTQTPVVTAPKQPTQGPGTSSTAANTVAQVPATLTSLFGNIDPTYLLLGGAAIVALLVLKK